MATRSSPGKRSREANRARAPGGLRRNDRPPKWCADLWLPCNSFSRKSAKPPGKPIIVSLFASWRLCVSLPFSLQFVPVLHDRLFLFYGIDFCLTENRGAAKAPGNMFLLFLLPQRRRDAEWARTYCLCASASLREIVFLQHQHPVLQICSGCPPDCPCIRPVKRTGTPCLETAHTTVDELPVSCGRGVWCCSHRGEKAIFSSRNCSAHSHPGEDRNSSNRARRFP
jgi:hypothetical protein